MTTVRPKRAKKVKMEPLNDYDFEVWVVAITIADTLADQGAYDDEDHIDIEFFLGLAQEKRDGALLEAADGSWWINLTGLDSHEPEAFKRWVVHYFPGIHFHSLVWADLLDENGVMRPVAVTEAGTQPKAAFPRLTEDLVRVIDTIRQNGPVTVAAIITATGIKRSSANNAIAGLTGAGVIGRGLLEPYRYRILDDLDDRQQEWLARAQEALGEL